MKKLISLFVVIALLSAMLVIPACKDRTVSTTTTTVEDIVDVTDDTTTDAQ